MGWNIRREENDQETEMRHILHWLFGVTYVRIFDSVGETRIERVVYKNGKPYTEFVRGIEVGLFPNGGGIFYWEPYLGTVDHSKQEKRPGD